MKFAAVALAPILVCLALGSAQAQSAAATPAGLNELNAELQGVWDYLRPTLAAELERQVRAELGALQSNSGSVDVSVKSVGSFRHDIAMAPAFRALTTRTLEIVLPRSGSWELEVEAVVRVKVRAWFVRMTFDVPVRLRIHDLGVLSTAALDDSDPTRPVVSQLNTPQVRFQIELRSSAWHYDLLLRLLTPVGDRLARRALGDALSRITPSLAGFSGLPGPIPGAGAAPLVDSGIPTPFLEVVDNVELKIRADHMPHGTLLETLMDTPTGSSWLSDYVNGGPGNVGQPVDWPDGGDSAIWTGHYLASQALRYSVTGSTLALDNVQHAVGGIGKLLDVNGGTGLLARVAAPESSHKGQEIVNRFGTHGRTVIGGQVWVWRQGGNGISRDQITGVLTGLILAYDLVPAVKPECARRIQMILDYLIRNDWLIDEDRRAFSFSPHSSFPTYWMGVPYQRVTFLLMGERVAPGRYTAELQAASPLASTAWLGAWIASFNLDSYYKFNLTHTAHYGYFWLETDAARRQEMSRGFAITSRFTGHHANAHFDLVQASADPSTRASKHSTVRETLRQFLDRPHRHVGPSLVDLSQVTWVTYTLPTITLPGQQPLPQQRTLPSEPLPVRIRHPEGNFLWQRTCFRPAVANGGNPNFETPGIDLTLPYWMGRHDGAF